MTTTTIRQKIMVCLALCAGLLAIAQAQADELRVARQYGIAYIPLMVMQEKGLIEKHAANAGIKDLKVDWRQFTGGAIMNDALLSNTLDIAVAGGPPFLTLWSKTQGRDSEVIGLASLNTMPMYLMVRNPEIKSIRDFSDKDKIVVSGVKVSAQAIYLQMAAAKEWGIKEHDRLDKYTVAMPLSDSMAIMLSGRGEVTADFTVPPFSYREMKMGIKPLLDSFQVVGTPNSTNLVYTTKKFMKENPKLSKAYLDALKEAQDFVTKDKRASAEIYIKLANSKDTPEEVVEMLNDPRVDYNLTPRGVMAFAQFMHSIGTLPTKPDNWKSLFISDIHHLSGD